MSNLQNAYSLLVVVLGLIASLLISSKSFGQLPCCQNLIPNGSFESYSSLPSNDCDWALAEGWTNASNTSFCSPQNGTPDYYHLNGSGDFSSLPTNYFATDVIPPDGEAVMGMGAYFDFFADAREYLSIALSCPMVVGESYEFSFLISLGTPEATAYKVNGFGARFSVGELLQQDGCNCPISTSPQFEITEVIDNNDWQEYKVIITADEPYDHFTFGNFYTDDELEIESTGINSGFGISYYFVDDFVLRPLSVDTLQVDLGADTSLCLSGDLLLDAGGFPGATYEWSTGATTPDISINDSGIYSVTVTGNCSQGSDTIVVALSSNEVVVQYDTICVGEQLEWNGVFYNTSGLYTEVIPNGAANGCDVENSLDLQVIEPTYEDTFAYLCPGATFVWMGQNYTAEGSYEVIVPGGGVGGCDLIANLELVEESSFTVDTLVVLCNGEEFELAGEVYAESGFYQQKVEGASVGGCDLWYDIQIEKESGSLFLEDVDLQLGASVTIEPQLVNISNLERIEWTSGEGLSCEDCLTPTLTPTQSGVYTLRVDSEAGCSYEGSFRLNLDETIRIFVPNAFSPNDDGFNDYFYPNLDPTAVKAIPVMRIFDRWGGVIYEGRNLSINDSGSGWDGRSNNRILDPGIYVYYFELVLQNDRRLVYSGDVFLSK